MIYIDLNTVAELQQTFPQPNTDQSCSKVILGYLRGSMCPSQSLESKMTGEFSGMVSFFLLDNEVPTTVFLFVFISSANVVVKCLLKTNCLHRGLTSQGQPTMLF